MKELLLFLSGFILCFLGYKFFLRNQNKPTSSKNLSEIQNIILSEQKVLDQIPDQIIIINKKKTLFLLIKNRKRDLAKTLRITISLRF